MRLILHLGAHRTGSTLVDDTLARSLRACPESGVAMWRPDVMRGFDGFGQVPHGCHADGTPDLGTAVRRHAAVKAEFQKRFSGLRGRGVHSLIASDENMLGSMDRNLREACLYPALGARLRAYAHALAVAPARIAIAVRDYAAVWRSMAGFLASRGADRDISADFGTGVLAQHQGWPSVIDQIRSVWPLAQIVIWQQERLAPQIAEICGRIADLPARIMRVRNDPTNRTPAKHRALPLFRPDEDRHLRALYVQDIAVMREDPELIWIDGGAV